MASALDARFTEAIKEAMALADAEDVILETIEFRHPSIVDAGGNPSGLRFVNDYGSLVSGTDDDRVVNLTLEADAPIDAGRSVAFVACAFTLTPAGQEQGGKPTLQIEMDGIAAAISDQLDGMVDSAAAPIAVTYRLYLASKPEAPQAVSPHATVNSVSCTLTRVSAEAGYPDTINRTFPGKLYRPDEYPSLAE